MTSVEQTDDLYIKTVTAIQGFCSYHHTYLPVNYRNQSREEYSLISNEVGVIKFGKRLTPIIGYYMRDNVSKISPGESGLFPGDIGDENAFYRWNFCLFMNICSWVGITINSPLIVITPIVIEDPTIPVTGPKCVGEESSQVPGFFFPIISIPLGTHKWQDGIEYISVRISQVFGGGSMGYRKVTG